MRETEQRLWIFELVRPRGLEPLPVAGMEPKSIVSANFTTGASKPELIIPHPPSAVQPQFSTLAFFLCLL